MATGALANTGFRIPAATYDHEAYDTPVRKFGAYVLFFFLFLAFSRVLDLKFSSLRVPFVTSLVGLACAIFGARLHRAVATRVGRLFSAFTIWMALGIPFAYWRAEAVGATGEWLKSYMLFMLVVSLICSTRECRQGMATISLGVVVLAVIALRLKFLVENRLGMPGGTFQNPNDLAQAMLVGLPFTMLGAVAGRGIVRRIVSVLMLAPVVLVVARTGSRGAMVAAALCMFLFFLRASTANKVKILVLGAVAMAAFMAATPRDLRARYLTFFSRLESSAAGGPALWQDAAIESAAQRRELLLNSLKITLRRPIFGVGAGNFQAYSAMDYQNNGLRAQWREAHNAYTQVSSELGIPGLVLYLAILFYCFSGLNALVRQCRGVPQLSQLSHTATALQFSLLAYSITAMFASTAYQFMFPCLAGLSMALIETGAHEIRRAQVAAVPPAAFTIQPAPPSPASRPAAPAARTAWKPRLD